MQHKIPSYFPLSLAFLEGDRRIKRLKSDLPNCQGLGILVAIYAQLTKCKDMSYPFDDIDILANDINTSIALTTTVINSFNLFQFFETNDGKMFFSIDLNTALQPYFNKIEINSQNAKIGVEKRRKKIEKQVQQLENKLSESDSSERPLSDGSATAEQREEKRREEKRTTTSAHEAEKSEIEKCSSSEFLSFASEKAEKNAKNKPAYIASLVARYENGDPSVILEFEEFEKARKKESIDDILYQFRNKTVNVNGSNYVLIGVEQSKIENEYILFSKCGKRLLANTSTLMHIFHSQLKGA